MPKPLFTHTSLAAFAKPLTLDARLWQGALTPSRLASASLLVWLVGCGSDPAPAPSTTTTGTGATGATTSTTGAGGSTATTTDATSATTASTAVTTDTTAATTTATGVTSDTSSTSATTGTSTTGGLPDGAIYQPCAADAVVGTFTVANSTGFSKVGGTVFDRTRITPPVIEAEAEGCQLRVATSYTCTPECAVGTTCSPQMVCETNAAAVSAGTVDITGLALDGLGSVSMMPGPQGTYQQVVPAPPYPAFAPGATVSLNASGGVVEAFALQTKGVDELVISAEVAASEDMPVSLTWTPPSSAQGKIQIELDIGHHGGSPARILCEVDDDGEFQIPQTLVAGLFAYGVWGFPKIEFIRRSVASTTIASGCVELAVESEIITKDVVIPGVVSCNAPEECATGETCEGLRCITPSE